MNPSFSSTTSRQLRNTSQIHPFTSRKLHKVHLARKPTLTRSLVHLPLGFLSTSLKSSPFLPNSTSLKDVDCNRNRSYNLDRSRSYQSESTIFGESKCDRSAKVSRYSFITQDVQICPQVCILPNHAIWGQSLLLVHRSHIVWRI